MKPMERLTFREVVLGLSSLFLMLFLAGFLVTSNRPGEPSLSGDLLRSVGIDFPPAFFVARCRNNNGCSYKKTLNRRLRES